MLTRIIKTIKKQLKVWKNTFKSFFNNHSFRHGAALSYYTLMALVPILYLVLMIFGAILGYDYIETNIRELFTELIGKQSIDTIFSAINQIDLSNLPWYIKAITILTLIYTTTAVFNILKININHIWNLNIEHRKLVIKLVIDRLLAFVFLLTLCIVFILIFVAETLVLSFNHMLYVNDYYALSLLFIILEHLTAIALNIVLFFYLFKLLPDGKVKNKHAFVGSAFTATFFYIGQFIISWYLGSVAFIKDLGAAGAIMLILVWIYYSSQIFFLGATYIKEYALVDGFPILPKNDRFLKRKRSYDKNDPVEK